MADIIHQLLIFGFINDCNNFISSLHIVSSDRLINGSSAVEIIYDKLSERFFFFSDNADSALDIMIKNKMIENNAIKVSS